MAKNKQMKIYENSLWSIIKNKFFNIFKKEKNSNKVIINDISNNKSLKTKEEIMEIYNKVKSKQMEVEEIDENTLDKIMILVKEEIDLINKKVEMELNDAKMHLYDLKNYVKDIELSKKKF